jgi:hypothetical protein
MPGLPLNELPSGRQINTQQCDARRVDEGFTDNVSSLLTERHRLHLIEIRSSDCRCDVVWEPDNLVIITAFATVISWTG